MEPNKNSSRRRQEPKKSTPLNRKPVKKEFRKFKYGYQLVLNSIQFIENNFKEKKILISAQAYLTKFYNSLGFIQVGESYLEDGIPHIKMLRN